MIRLCILDDHCYSIRATTKSPSTLIQDSSENYLLFSDADTFVDLGTYSESSLPSTSLDNLLEKTLKLQKVLKSPLNHGEESKYSITQASKLINVCNSVDYKIDENAHACRKGEKIYKMKPSVVHKNIQCDTPLIVSVQSNATSDKPVFSESYINTGNSVKLPEQATPRLYIDKPDSVSKQASIHSNKIPNISQQRCIQSGYQKVKHQNHYRYVCFLCKISYPSPDRVNRHMKSCHGIITDNAPLVCSLIMLKGKCAISDNLYAEPLLKHSNKKETKKRKGIISDDSVATTQNFPDTETISEEVENPLHKHCTKHPKKQKKLPAKFLCITCGRSFVYKHFLLTHMKKTHPKEPSQCSHCKKVFHNAIMLKTHMIEHTGIYPYQCSVCSNGFLFEKSLAKHLKEVHTINLYQCDLCKYALTSTLKLKMHKERVHFTVKAPKPIPESLCFLCGKYFKHLNDHIKRKHTVGEDRKKILCDQCPRSFLCAGAFRNHKRRHAGVKNFVCTIPACGKAFYEKRNLVAHLEMHSGVKRPSIYKCYCGKSFVRKAALTRHERTFHRDPCDVPVEMCHCQICNKTFSTRASLHMHTYRVHSKDKSDTEGPFSCEKCSRSFTRKFGLSIHIKKIHPELVSGTKSSPARPKRILQARRDENKLYPCKQCGNIYNKYISLWQHRKNVHLRDPTVTYPCSICNKTFSFYSSRALHMRTHSGVKSYACSFCPKTFFRADQRNIHLRVHTGEKPYTCNTCLRTFTQQGDMKKHRLKVHGY